MNYPKMKFLKVDCETYGHKYEARFDSYLPDGIHSKLM